MFMNSLFDEFLMEIEFRLREEQSSSQLAFSVANNFHLFDRDSSGQYVLDQLRRTVENAMSNPHFNLLSSDVQESILAACWISKVLERPGDEKFPKLNIESLIGWIRNPRAVEIVTGIRDLNLSEVDREELASLGRDGRLVYFSMLAAKFSYELLGLENRTANIADDPKNNYLVPLLADDVKLKKWLESCILKVDQKPVPPCQGCGCWLEPNLRYPRAICRRCKGKLTDANGKKVTFTNANAHGGISKNGIPIRSDEDRKCFLGAIECIAHEGHFGGIVVEVC